MKTQQLPASQYRNHIEDIDHALHRVGGCINALQLLSEDFGTHFDSPSSSAFWAVLGGAEAFLRDGQKASDDLHELLRTPQFVKGC